MQGPPSFPPAELDRLVSRIALYPDPLLAQVLAAATFSDQIPDAAKWADQHHYLTGDALAQAISGDQLPLDPSVQALLPFPSVLDMMASDMNWTSQLGNAFLAQQQEVMDAVQRNGVAFRPWGWGFNRFAWDRHTVFINNAHGAGRGLIEALLCILIRSGASGRRRRKRLPHKLHKCIAAM